MTNLSILQMFTKMYAITSMQYVTYYITAMTCIRIIF